MDLDHFREALLLKKQELVGASGVRPLQATMENNSRQGDMADQASGNNEVHIVGSSRVDLQACKLEYSIVSPK